MGIDARISAVIGVPAFLIILISGIVKQRKGQLTVSTEAKVRAQSQTIEED